MAAATNMIEPFEPGQVRSVDGKRIDSRGTSSYGHYIRCSDEFKIFNNINSSIVNLTPYEPEWEGFVTLEFSNTTPLPAKIHAGEGCAQVLFFESDEVCETSYKDRGGKYQGQKGVSLPKM